MSLRNVCLLLKEHVLFTFVLGMSRNKFEKKLPQLILKLFATRGFMNSRSIYNLKTPFLQKLSEMILVVETRNKEWVELSETFLLTIKHNALRNLKKCTRSYSENSRLLAFAIGLKWSLFQILYGTNSNGSAHPYT